MREDGDLCARLARTCCTDSVWSSNDLEAPCWQGASRHFGPRVLAIYAAKHVETFDANQHQTPTQCAPTDSDQLLSVEYLSC